MANLSYNLHDTIIAAIEGDTPMVGLMSAAPNPDGTSSGLEPNTMYGYAQQAITFEATTRDGSGRSIIKNQNALVFGPCVTTAWPTLTYIGLFKSNGALLAYAPLAASRTAQVGDSVSFGAEAIQFRLN